jgi:aspartate aminotransferase
MPKYINAIASRLKPSETLAVKTKAAELRAGGREIVDLSIGEPDFDTPAHIKAAAEKAMARGKTKYTDAAGIKELRGAIAEKLRRENGIEVDAAGVIVTNGGKQALAEAFQVMLDPGDQVLVIAPYWVSYPAMIELAGGQAVVRHTRPEDQYKLRPAALKQSLNAKTRCVIINSPSNPCGVMYNARELAELGEVLAQHDCLIVSDEVYEKMILGETKFSSFLQACPALASRTITVNAFSKTYAMTGWRVGYAAGPKEFISAMGKLQGQTTSNVNSIAQYAALAALSGPQDCVETMRQSYRRRLGLALEILSGVRGIKIPCRPEGSFFLLLDFSELQAEAAPKQAAKVSSSDAFVNCLLEEAGVALVPGVAFGEPSTVRMSLAAADQDLIRGLKAIERTAKALLA